MCPGSDCAFHSQTVHSDCAFRPQTALNQMYKNQRNVMNRNIVLDANNMQIFICITYGLSNVAAILQFFFNSNSCISYSIRFFFYLFLIVYASFLFGFLNKKIITKRLQIAIFDTTSKEKNLFSEIRNHSTMFLISMKSISIIY